MDIYENLHCDFCGKSVEESESYELLDGCICKNCAQKLSPWFTEYDLAEVEELQEQIRLREQNRKNLLNFHPTRRFGDKMMIVVDDSAKTFVVTDSFDLIQANPDIIPLEDVIDATVDPDSDKRKIEGKRYEYSYQFQVEITVEHPFLYEIKFPLNEPPIRIEGEESGFFGMGRPDPEENAEYCALQETAERIEDVLMDMEDVDDPTSAYDVRPGEFRTSEEPALCPWCGGKTEGAENGLCPHCGGPLE